jgi:hypothetical protein
MVSNEFKILSRESACVLVSVGRRADSMDATQGV